MAGDELLAIKIINIITSMFLKCNYIIFSLLSPSLSLLVKFTSYILGQNEAYHDSLETMVSEVTPNNNKWTRCYHAKSDGFTAHDFHSRCDNKGPTITLVRVRESIFGGFLDQNWGGNDTVLSYMLRNCNCCN